MAATELSFFVVEIATREQESRMRLEDAGRRAPATEQSRPGLTDSLTEMVRAKLGEGGPAAAADLCPAPLRPFFKKVLWAVNGPRTTKDVIEAQVGHMTHHPCWGWILGRGPSRSLRPRGLRSDSTRARQALSRHYVLFIFYEGGCAGVLYRVLRLEQRG